jgi:hypothetical protein
MVFIERLQSDLAEGKSILLEAPVALPIPLDRCLSDRLSARFHWIPLAVGEDPPLACIRRILPNTRNASLSSPGQLYDIAGFGNRILYLTDIAPTRLGVWVSFLVEFAHASRQRNVLERSAFLVNMNGGRPVQFSEDLLLVRRRWEGVIDETDALLLALRVIRSSGLSPVLSNLKAALCTELAQWDLALCDDFSRRSMPSLLNPASLLVDYARNLRWDTVAPDEAEDTLWRHGILQTYRGRRRLHNAWHALQGRLEEIQSAIWRAELKVLFPFIEEQCLRIIQRHDSYLRVPHIRKDKSVLNALLDFEIVDVDYQFQENTAVPRQLRDYVRKLWLMRNKLAHRTCLESAMLAPEILDFDVDSVPWSGGRV